MKSSEIPSIASIDETRASELGLEDNKAIEEDQNSQSLKQIPLDEGNIQKTVLDTGSESDEVTGSWGEMSSSGGILQVEPTTGELSESASSSASPLKNPKSKRSPNRDDSDSSEDEDDLGNKLEKRLKDVEMTDMGYDPTTDSELLSKGFKVGFAEDRNKRYRRTMEVASTYLIAFRTHILYALITVESLDQDFLLFTMVTLVELPQITVVKCYTETLQSFSILIQQNLLLLYFTNHFFRLTKNWH